MTKDIRAAAERLKQHQSLSPLEWAKSPYNTFYGTHWGVSKEKEFDDCRILADYALSRLADEREDDGWLQRQKASERPAMPAPNESPLFGRDCDECGSDMATVPYESIWLCAKCADKYNFLDEVFDG